jgi:hypothetical protein
MSQTTGDYNHSTQGAHIQPLNSTKMGNTPNIEYAKLWRTLRMDRNSWNRDVGRPLMKTSAYWDVVGSCITEPNRGRHAPEQSGDQSQRVSCTDVGPDWWRGRQHWRCHSKPRWRWWRSSLCNWRSHEASATQLATAQHSASMLDRETVCWRLKDQDTRLSLRNTA